MVSRFTRTFIAIIFALFLITSLGVLHPQSKLYLDPWSGDQFGDGGVEQRLTVKPHEEVVKGKPIMQKLGNETAKAELGRATWKLLHTMTLRYPEDPSLDEKEALNSYFHLFSRLYPCGECAAEFQMLLKKFPPQTSSRRSAALWLCTVHNEVNKRLKKSEFDCANLDATYDCGCGDAPVRKPNKDERDDLEKDFSKDEVTGVDLIGGG
ncbi:hypothetical protein BDM02DRAFT_3097690 [Thelephora ganbajun]|uniref:Uncharacterized protein n=1 Tax=Thelephora ganbajun TaxID=370292 RepID=A0ACB6ZDN5_THEGA|nr:hypothetical protein BDM02DRAFT_3097690 [Thelephora ganbajun]